VLDHLEIDYRRKATLVRRIVIARTAVEFQLRISLSRLFDPAIITQSFAPQGL
jgi:hypothetical protein